MERQPFVKSPLAYMGSKYRLLDELVPLFPEKVGTFLDLFCGGGSISANVVAARILSNDRQEPLVGLYRWLRETPFESVESEIRELSEGYYPGGETTEREYLRLRSDYNASPSPARLFLLIRSSFSNQIRFGAKGFNMPFGKRCALNISLRRLRLFAERLRKAEFSSLDFREAVGTAKLGPSDFLYCDPPYLVTTACYNEKGGWTECDERDLYALLDTLDSAGVRFGVSNVFVANGRTNEILLDWSKRYRVYHLRMDYSNCASNKLDRESPTDEVYICNYEPPKKPFERLTLF